MAKRVVLGRILGGLTMFVWLFVAHDFLPLGELGVQEIANDGPVLTDMQAAIPQAGLYLFPVMGLGPNPTMQQRNAAMPAYMKKYEQSPHGILVYHPPSGAFNFGAALARAGFVVILGVLAAITTSLEYWNWYDFPGNYVAGYMVTQIIGFTLVGLVVAAFVKSEVAPGS